VKSSWSASRERSSKRLITLGRYLEFGKQANHAGELRKRTEDVLQGRVNGCLEQIHVARLSFPKNKNFQ
jgi:hypothetical protein